MRSEKRRRTQTIVAPATAGDVDAIYATIKANHHDPAMFLRSRSDLKRNISDFIVARDSDGRMLGCAALRAYSTTVAEILSVSVLPTCQGIGVGQLLVQEALVTAQARGFLRLWLATSKPGYFTRLGFERISRWELPAAVLLAKLRQVFGQPLARWIPALFGRFTFMEYSGRDRTA